MLNPEGKPYPTRWSNMAAKHWKRYLPIKSAQLVKEGRFEEETLWAGQKTEDMLVDLISNGGLRPNEAEEIVLPQFILLQPEQ